MRRSLGLSLSARLLHAAALLTSSPILILAVTTVDHAKLDHISSELGRRNSSGGKKFFLSGQLRKLRRPSCASSEASSGTLAEGSEMLRAHGGKQARFKYKNNSFENGDPDSCLRRGWAPIGWRPKQVSCDSLLAAGSGTRAVRRKSTPGSLDFYSPSSETAADVGRRTSHGQANGEGCHSSTSHFSGRSPLGGAHQVLSRFGGRMMSFEKSGNHVGSEANNSGPDKDPAGWRPSMGKKLEAVCKHNGPGLSSSTSSCGHCVTLSTPTVNASEKQQLDPFEA
jgi:hypothetical protein